MAWFNLHCHSQFSALDGMTPVPDLVAKAVELGYPALGLSDHGNMAGVTQLYLEAKKHGIKPFPGEEFYLIDPRQDIDLTSKDASKAPRMHMGMYARTTAGYLGLVKLTSLSHTRPRFSRFPRITRDDLRDFGKVYGGDVIVTTGCYFGWLVQTLLDDGPDAAEGVLDALTGWGYTDVFVELQHHGVHDHTHNDDDLVEDLYKLAQDNGYPVLATADNHYLDQHQKSAHALMKRMVYGGKDDEFPGDSFHLPSAEWVEEHYPIDIWEQVEKSCDYLLERHDLTIPPLDDYKPRIPKIAAKPDKVLTQAVLAGLLAKGLTGAEYTKRAKYELGVIKKLGMADYFLHYRQIIEFCEREGIVKEARGSANASLVCYALGVTSLDPIKFKLTFERFLSEDRIKPPDIDLDVEDNRRGDVLEFLRQDYDVVQIGTWGLLGSNDDGTGSALVSYMTYRANQAQTPNERSGVYARYRAGGLDAVKEDYPKDYKGLKQISDMNSVFKSYGVHPAGLLLNTDDFQVRDWIPTMLVASSNTEVTQYNMDDLEAWGVLKDDILGQTILRVMRRCQEIAGRADPTDFSWMPEENVPAMKQCRVGRTSTGVFHLEAYTKGKGAKELGVRSVNDLILLQALYMPGAMNSGAKDAYLARRNTLMKSTITYPHPIWQEVLEDTYGVVIFQEQVIEIMRKLGMSIATINVLFKVVKDSGRGSHERNEKRMATIRQEFDEHCTQHGVADLDAAWDSLVGMMNYGFNRAHATGYGIRSYRTAYLKARYMCDYLTSLLEAWSFKDPKRERDYISEARKNKHRIIPAQINESGVTWVKAGSNRIRKGLISVHGIGEAAAYELIKKQPYTSIDDLAQRVNARAVSGGAGWLKNGVLGGRLKDLNDAGVFEGLPEHEPEGVL